VPELCYVTGMTEEITSDFRIMKDIAQQTRISPMQRHNALLDFVQNVNGKILFRRESNWKVLNVYN